MARPAVPDKSIQAALNLLFLWKAVRPSAVLGEHAGAELLSLGLTEEVLTILGNGMTLSRQGRLALGLSSRVVSDTVVVNALFRQDARADLSRAGYQNLRPGNGAFCVVENKKGHACPLLGRVTSRGYSSKRIRELAEGMETDLILGKAKLVVIVPQAVDWKIPRVETVVSLPRWSEEIKRQKFSLPRIP